MVENFAGDLFGTWFSLHFSMVESLRQRAVEAVHGSVVVGVTNQRWIEVLVASFLGDAKQTLVDSLVATSGVGWNLECRDVSACKEPWGGANWWPDGLV